MAATNMSKTNSSTYFTPRWYQQEAIDAIYEFLADGEGHPVVAVPTGAGKTAIICGVIEKLMKESEHIKILIISHVQEILVQNHESIIRQLKFIPGLYSAGLDSKDIRKVTVAGIQSIYRKPELFEEFDFIIIDEAHTIPIKNQKGMYRTFLDALEDTTCIGLTATHFRTNDGYIHEGEDALFTDLVYDLSSRDNFNRLVDEGYLSKLISKKTELTLNLSGVRTLAGEFNNIDLSNKFDRDSVTVPIVDETIKFGRNYKKWLIFAIDIAHAEHMAETLRSRGISTACIHSKMLEDRETVIDDIKAGKYRATVNVDVLTTGFDDPAIDLIVLARPTKSPIFHVQSVGRGSRVSPGKDHTLVLDFAGNTARLGPINDIVIKKKGKGGGGDAPIKTCPDCGVIHHPSVRVCDICDYHFQFKHGLEVKSSEEKIVANEFSDPPPAPKAVSNEAEWFNVQDVYYSLNKKHGGPSSMRVTYVCNNGMKSVQEWVCPDHKGWVKAKADAWSKYRLGYVPDTLADLLLATNKIKKPSRILVDKQGTFDRILNSVF